MTGSPPPTDQPAPPPEDQPILTDLSREFSEFAVWREEMPGRTRFAAQRISSGPGLFCVITADLGELRDILTQTRKGNGPPSGPGT